MDVSVVICTRNRKADLLTTLDSVAKQSLDIPWEVVVIDNGSEDGTRSAVGELAASFPVPLGLYVEPEQGVSFARNRALAVSRGSILLFLDDDATCHSGWLEAHLRTFEDPEVAGTGGRILPLLPSDAPAWFRDSWGAGVGGPTSSYDFGEAVVEVGGATSRVAPFGTNMGVRSELALRVGGFRTDLGWGRRMIPGEETDLFNRISEIGGRYVYVSDAVVHHRIRRECCQPAYVLRWYRGYGRALVRADASPRRGERLNQVARQARKVLEYRLVAYLRRIRGGRAYADALRRAGKSQGMLLELLGL